MTNYAILSSSVRTARNSHRVAIFLQKLIEKRQSGTVTMLDLNEYQFPVFTERLRFQPNPHDKLKEFTQKFKDADGLIIVTPEYNGGYPAALKNVIDLYGEEWYHKPVALAAVSEGIYGASQVLTSLQFTLWKLKAFIAPAPFQVKEVSKTFDESGNLQDEEAGKKMMHEKMLEELNWLIEAKRRMSV